MRDSVHPDAVTIFGATFDESLEDEIRITVIATGFAENQSEEDQSKAQQPAAAQPVSQQSVPQPEAPQSNVSPQAQKLNESLDQEAKTARDNMDRAYDDIIRVLSRKEDHKESTFGNGEHL